MTAPEKCRKCDGTGKIKKGKPCARCGGSGQFTPPVREQESAPGFRVIARGTRKTEGSTGGCL